MENVAELIPHRLGRAPPFLFEHYKMASRAFPLKTHRIYSKKVIQEKLFTLKSIQKLIFFG